MTKKTKNTTVVCDHPAVRIPINVFHLPTAKVFLEEIRKVTPEMENYSLGRLLLFKLWLAFGRVQGGKLRGDENGIEMLEHSVGWRGQPGKLYTLLKTSRVLRLSLKGELSLASFREYNVSESRTVSETGEAQLRKGSIESFWVPTDLFNWRSSFLLIVALQAASPLWGRERVECLIFYLWRDFGYTSEGRCSDSDCAHESRDEYLGWEGGLCGLTAILMESQILRAIPDDDEIVLRGFTALNVGQSRAMRPSCGGVDSFAWGEVTLDEIRQSEVCLSRADLSPELLAFVPKLSPSLEERLQSVLESQFAEGPISRLEFLEKARKAIIDFYKAGGIKDFVQPGDMSCLEGRNLSLMRMIEEVRMNE